MKIKNKLIFLISQPRSGSTLLQKLLGHHSEIYTCPEPWLMLQPLYVCKQDGVQANYDEALARKGHNDFFAQFPEGGDRYLREIERAYGRIYEACAENNGKNIFLDKTPRYYLIVDELLQCFQQASFLLLVRNPLAVFSSIVHSFYAGNFEELFRNDKHYIDIIEGPQLMAQALNMHSSQCMKVQYEALVSDKENTLRDVCQYVGLDFEEDVLSYRPKEEEKGKFGDQWNIYKHTSPTTKYIDVWQQQVIAPKQLGFMEAYWDFLGSEINETLGYSYSQGQDELKKLYEHCNFNEPDRGVLSSGRQQFTFYAIGLYHEINTIAKIIGSSHALDLFNKEGFEMFGTRKTMIVDRMKRCIKSFIEREDYALSREWLEHVSFIPQIKLCYITDLYDHAISLLREKDEGYCEQVEQDEIAVIEKWEDDIFQKTFALAHRLFLRGRYKDSVDHFSRYLDTLGQEQRNPCEFLTACECMTIMAQKGYCMSEEIYTKKAIAFMKEQAKETHYVNYEVASFLKRTYQLDKARALFQNIADQRGDDELRGKAHYHLGDIAEKLGDRAHAQKEFSLAVALYPEHKMARERLICEQVC